MIHTILSDHTADQMNEKEAQREREYEAAYKRYTQAQDDRKRKISDIRGNISESWESRKLLRLIACVFSYVSLILDGKPKCPIKQGLDEEDRIWESGHEGEKKVYEHLNNLLNDSWHLMSGYKNNKGEIDKILVGPSGIYAIEVKNINGTIYCDGDIWYRNKYDKYGNLVETNIPIKDKKGRSPSRQLNEPADMLQSFLRKTNPSIDIKRIVILTHSNSLCGKLNYITVNNIVTLSDIDIEEMFIRKDSIYSGSDIERIVKQINRDHNYMMNKYNSNRSNGKRVGV